MLTPTHGGSDHSEDQTLCLNYDLTQNAGEKKSIFNISIKSSLVPQPNSDHQPLSYNFHEAENQDNKEDKHIDLGLTRKAEPKSQMTDYNSKSHRNSVCQSHLNTPTGKTYFTCDACGKDFLGKYNLKRHLRAHSGEKPYFCNICGNSFNNISTLKRHKTIHTGERPYSCKTCGKKFRLNSDLTVHMRTHTGEKPHKCNTCGKRYCRKLDLKKHIRIHTSEKQSIFQTWESSEVTCGPTLVRNHTTDTPVGKYSSMCLNSQST